VVVVLPPVSAKLGKGGEEGFDFATNTYLVEICRPLATNLKYRPESSCFLAATTPPSPPKKVLVALFDNISAYLETCCQDVAATSAGFCICFSGASNAGGSAGIVGKSDLTTSWPGAGIA